MRIDRPGLRTSRVVAIVAMALGATALGACGSSEELKLSPQAEAGSMTSKILGCAGCHGVFGQGGVGSAWKGLAGSKVTLQDGSVVTADEAYLRRSITDPRAQQVKGYRLTMPTVAVSEQQMEELLAYIQALR